MRSGYLRLSMILDISKIESGKIVLEQIPFCLHDVLSHCQSIIMPKIEEKGITLYCYAEPSIEGKLIGDPVRLRQAIVNLLSNGIKFTNSGTVKLLVSIIDCDKTSITTHFEIKDSGIGMCEDQIARIFAPFTQGDGSITRKFGGTGLGLTITKNIIDLMGGKLEVESTLGVGSRFSFDLKFDFADDTHDESSFDEVMFTNIEKPIFEGEVLVCEDNNLNQQVICDHLSRVGIRTVLAQNGKEGVNIILERIAKDIKPFDLILMDIHMPVMDGLEAAAKITALYPNMKYKKTPIVAITANIMSNDLELYKTSGMSDCIGKPFTAIELWKCLSKFLPVKGHATIDHNRQSVQDEKTKKQLKIIFAKENGVAHDEFIKALDSGDIKLAHRLVHTLKGVAGQIGEKRLQAAASVVESALSTGKNLLVGEQLNILETELKTVLKKLSPLLIIENKNKAIKSPSVRKSVDVEESQDVFKKLRSLLENNDTECLELIDDLAAIKGAEKLIGHIENYDFKQAIDELENL